MLQVHPLHASKTSSLHVWVSFGCFWMWLAKGLWWDLKCLEITHTLLRQDLHCESWETRCTMWTCSWQACVALPCPALPSSSKRAHQFLTAWMHQSRELFCACTLGAYSGHGCHRTKPTAWSQEGKHEGEAPASLRETELMLGKGREDIQGQDRPGKEAERTDQN